VTEVEKTEMTPLQIRNEILKSAPEIIELLSDLVKHSSKGIAKTQQMAIDTLWPTIHTVAIKAQDREAIEAKTAQDIIGLLSKGKLSITEAKDLMSMMHDKADIDEAEGLLARVEEIESKLKQEK